LRIENYYRLKVKALIPYGLHIYSIFQEGGPPATVLTLGPNYHISVVRDWAEIPEAQTVEYDWGSVKVLKDSVEWVVDFKMVDFNNPIPPVVDGTLTMYPCTDNMCLMPQTVEFTTGD
jgi:hypothetical protein